MSRLVTLALALLVALPAQAGQRARYGGELRVVAPALPASLDPAQLTSPVEVAAARLVFGTPFTLSAEGVLGTDLAAVVPEVEAGGRLVRVKLRPGARFHDGTPVSAADLVASLTRLADPALASPFAALTLPLVGAAEGRLSGLTATGEGELQASLAFPYPDWPRALAHPAAAALPGGKPSGKPVGSGPLLATAAPDGKELRLLAFAECPAGRAFADSLRFLAADARAAGRALSLGEADAVLGSTDKKAVEGPALFATYLALNPARLAANLGPIRQAVEASIDVRDLARFFVRGAAPMSGLLPPALDPSAPPATSRPSRPAVAAGMQLSLILDASAEDQRAVGERLQVKLHDYGVAVQLKRLSRADYRRALAQGGYDLALVAFAALPEPGLALAQLVAFAQGRDAARELLRRVGAGGDPAARRALALSHAAALRSRLPLLPLYAQPPRLLVRPGVARVGFDGCGAPALADAWFAEGRPPAPPR